MIMTQEQKDLKDLLLKDLCGRLPYGVKARVYNHWRDEFQEETITIENLHQLIKTFSIGDIKPYLFPLSSMTEEQWKELQSLMIHDSYSILYHTLESFNWLLKNHFDIYELIPMGLANDATGLNIY